ncbi:hypothetical protein [Actinopolyspora erythraea]|uniref:hypothetical protein n=1 Tax=Actinopolyspora erythraea TaxID=414996 RepID=UPI0018E04731|nr:hypothetical protein [Actinopolyspora erythraea]
MAVVKRTPRFEKDFKKLTREQRRTFQHVLDTKFLPALDQSPPSFPPSLRVKRVHGTNGVREMTWDGDGRMTWQYELEHAPGVTTVILRRVGTHGIFGDP